MKKLIILVAILASGCAKAPPPPPPSPVDQTALGKDIAAFKVACGPGAFVRINNHHARILFEYQSFQELDAYLERTSRLDPVETLCTPTSMLLELRSLQKVETQAWMVYYAQRWVGQPKHSSWAEAARAIAYMDDGQKFCDSTWNREFPPWDRGQDFLQKGQAEMERLDKAHPSRPALEILKYGPNNHHPIFAMVREHPTEIALYSQLDTIMQSHPGERNKGLKSLGKAAPDCYALFFTLQLRSASGKFTAGKWEWELLKKGFEKLLQEHPNALGVRNAYAVAALAYEDKALAAEQVGLLGYHWDPDFWGSLRDYQNKLDPDQDRHLAVSQLPSLKWDESIGKVAWLEHAGWQAQCLLQKGFFGALETFLKELPQPDLRVAAAEALESGREENEASYKNQEALLREWQKARSESPLVATALGGFYISYAWLARGSGTADTVSMGGWQKFKERIENASRFLNAPITDQTDGLTLRHKMTLLKAGEFDRQAADRLALTAARRGLEGVPALEGYFNCLLPRWHGQPGDLVAACDQLKQEVGNDDAFYVMANLVFDAEGTDALLDPEHPSHCDWKRALSSYLSAAKHHRSSPHWAHMTLWTAFCAHQRSGAGQLVPYLPVVDALGRLEEPACLIGLRDWADGKADLVAWKEEKFLFKPIGSKRQKSSAQAQMGIAIQVVKPLMFGEHLAMDIHSPKLDSRDGAWYRESAVVTDVFPGTMGIHELLFKPGRIEELVPGTYHLELYVGGEVMHKETFELTP